MLQKGMAIIQTKVNIGELTPPSQIVTVQRNHFYVEEQYQIDAAVLDAAGYVVLQTEHGPWRFLVTHTRNNSYSFINDVLPGEDV